MESFATRARKSRESLLREGEEVLSAGRRFGQAVRQEAFGWRDYLRTRALVAGKDVRALPNRLEERVLGAVDTRLGRLDGRVRERLRLLRDGAPAAEAPPLPDYEALTAKDIVSRLEKLEPARARAVYEFERAHKGRATVLKAAQQRAA